MEAITSGLVLLFQLGPLLWLTVGLVAGFFVGVLPGFAGSSAAAVLLPFTIRLETENALLLLGGIYAGASFAGGVPAILINVPGTGSAAATALDGYPMAQQGKGALAIGLARTASSIGGIIGGVITLLVIGPMAMFAVRFGPAEMFLIAVFGLTIIATVVGEQVWKGLLAGVLGMLIAVMSADPITARARFDMGFLGLYDRVPFVPAIIGLFAITQMVMIAGQGRFVVTESRGGESRKDLLDGIMITLRKIPMVIRSSVLGTLIGAIPGAGTAVATFFAYGVAKQRSNHPETFGTGEPEGVIAAEGAENACAAGTLVPTLALGVPGSGTAAVMLAALYVHGIQPGPRVLVQNAPEAYALLWGMILASILILPIGILFASPLIAITRVPPKTLVPVVLVACMVGAYAMRNSLFDVFLTLAFGALGIAMRLNGYPIIPMVLGLILGPMAESNFMRALMLGNYTVNYFFETTIAKVLTVLLIFSIAPSVRRALKKRRSRTDAATTATSPQG